MKLNSGVGKTTLEILHFFPSFACSIQNYELNCGELLLRKPNKREHTITIITNSQFEFGPWSNLNNTLILKCKLYIKVFLAKFLMYRILIVFLFLIYYSWSLFKIRKWGGKRKEKKPSFSFLILYTYKRPIRSRHILCTWQSNHSFESKEKFASTQKLISSQTKKKLS